jgi:cytoplasmic iron level regulating protein YaaA (DUF328/UPF0246 family)
MLVVISPAKLLDYKTTPVIEGYTMPDRLDESEQIIEELRKKSPEQIAELMNLSFSLGQLNFERYQIWHQPFSTENAKQAVLTFAGEVFRGLDANSLSEKQLLQLQSKLRILSGLHGVLKPLDLIQPYRLEMGAKLKVGKHANLYSFWKGKISDAIKDALAESGSNILVNLASKEYFKSIDTKKLDCKIVTPEFKNMKNGKYKVIVVYAKKARGLMTRFILENNIENEDDLLAFDVDGYVYNPRLSNPDNPVFTRG